MVHAIFSKCGGLCQPVSRVSEVLATSIPRYEFSHTELSEG